MKFKFELSYDDNRGKYEDENDKILCIMIQNGDFQKKNIIEQVS